MCFYQYHLYAFQPDGRFGGFERQLFSLPSMSILSRSMRGNLYLANRSLTDTAGKIATRILFDLKPIWRNIE